MRPFRDHPRVCGEKLHRKLSATIFTGSPPRMRGKEIDQSGYKMKYGITPAYAGKRSRNRIDRHTPWDHPRVCGEKTKKIP